MSERFAIVMAGGSGERFWPLTKPGRLKQLLRLTHPEKTMLTEAIERAAPLVGEGNVIAATSRALREPFLAAGLPEDRVFAEPSKRNTLGCLVWVAANLISSGHATATVGVLTADHLIGDPDRFRENVRAAFEIAEQRGGIVTLGIPPDRPETGFGYIEADLETTVEVPSGHGKRCIRFREKPDLTTAQQFVDAGNFFWNSGMFFYTLESFLAELQESVPVAHAITLRIAEALAASDQASAEAIFDELPNISIDYAVMEKAKQVTVIPADFAWDDVGSWDAMDRTRPRDAAGNVFEGDVVGEDTQDTIVLNHFDGIPVGVVGLRDVVVVATPDGILVCPKSHAQHVRNIASHLAKRTT